MTQRSLHSAWWLDVVALATVLTFAGPAWGEKAPSAGDQTSARSAAEETKGGPVVRAFGAQGGYRTEVTSETRGTLSQEDRRQAALLTAHLFQHVDEARRALEADDLKAAHAEVDKGRQAIKAVRALLPRTALHTKTTAPDGSVIYEDRREVQEDRVPLFEGMLSAKTLAPIVAAKRDAANENAQDAAEVKGVRLVASEAINTQVLADLKLVEAQLGRAAKALDGKKADEAAKALAVAQVRGVELRYDKEDTPLAEARDAMWLARRSLEENDPAQARANLGVARQSLRLYQKVAPQERRQDVDQMLKEADELDAKLRQETAQHPASQGERTRQGDAATRWWERINEWFRRR